MKNKIIGHLLKFLLIICLVMLVMCLTLNFTFLDKNYMLKKLDKVNYYGGVYNNIYSNYQNNLMSTGIEEELQDVVNQDMVKSDILKVINSIYEGKDVQLNLDTLKKLINERIDAAVNGINLTEEDYQNIQKLENNLLDIYRDEIIVNSKIINTLSEVYKPLKSIIYAFSIVLVLVMLNIAAIVILLFKDDISVSVVSSGLILIIIYLLMQNKYQSILMFSKVFSDLVILIISSILNVFLIIGVLMLIIGFGMTLIKTIKNLNLKS